jgi:hypothetical protein
MWIHLLSCISSDATPEPFAGTQLGAVLLAQSMIMNCPSSFAAANDECCCSWHCNLRLVAAPKISAGSQAGAALPAELQHLVVTAPLWAEEAMHPPPAEWDTLPLP